MDMSTGTRLSTGARTSFTTVSLKPFSIERLAAKPETALIWIPAFTGTDTDSVACAFNAKTRGVGTFAADATGLLRIADLGTTFNVLKVLNANQAFHARLRSTGLAGESSPLGGAGCLARIGTVRSATLAGTTDVHIDGVTPWGA